MSTAKGEMKKLKREIQLLKRDLKLGPTPTRIRVLVGPGEWKELR